MITATLNMKKFINLYKKEGFMLLVSNIFVPLLIVVVFLDKDMR